MPFFPMTGAQDRKAPPPSECLAGLPLRQGCCSSSFIHPTRPRSWARIVCHVGTRRSTASSRSVSLLKAIWRMRIALDPSRDLGATDRGHRRHHWRRTDRRRHNRHAPPNAMLNFFWRKIPSFQGETRPKPITQYDPNVTHPAAICRGPIPEGRPGIGRRVQDGLILHGQAGQSDDDRPSFLAAVAYDEYYNDISGMIADLGKLLHQLPSAIRGRMQAHPDRRTVFHRRQRPPGANGGRGDQYLDRGTSG